MKKQAKQVSNYNDEKGSLFNALITEEEAAYIKNYFNENNQQEKADNLPQPINLNFDLRKFSLNFSKVKKTA